MLYDDELYMLKSNKIYVMLCYKIPVSKHKLNKACKTKIIMGNFKTLHGILSKPELLPFLAQFTTFLASLCEI